MLFVYLHFVFQIHPKLTKKTNPKAKANPYKEILGLVVLVLDLVCTPLGKNIAGPFF